MAHVQVVVDLGERCAVEAVKGAATDAAATVKDEGTSAAADVKGQAQDAMDTVTQQ